MPRLELLEEVIPGTSVVSSSKGVEGLEVALGEDILIPDTTALEVIGEKLDQLLRQVVKERETK